ncbi:MAG TPA: LysR family transcriptional regulator [Ktedonobacterales bacterium]|jgi:DNA-binding transcriptional LysR family regulator|nr:LysR family transcriptional regulator [Ktedonobacterales bacterium]
MELRQFAYFVAVATTGSYHAAAERLHVAQPALWSQVQSLQRELGLALFERAGRGVRLTRAGTMLLEPAQRILAETSRFRAAAEDLRVGRTGVIAIACYTPHLERFLAPVIGQFERAHPEVRVEIHEFAATRGGVTAIAGSLAELLDGSVDIALGPRHPNGVEGFKVDESTVVALVASDHAWAARSEIHIAELRDQPLLLVASRESFSRSAIEHACHAAGFEPSVKLDSASPLALTRLAEQSVGVAVVPDALAPSDFKGRLLRITGAGDTLRRETWFYWREGALTTSSVVAFVEEARRAVDVLVDFD